MARGTRRSRQPGDSGPARRRALAPDDGRAPTPHDGRALTPHDVTATIALARARKKPGSTREAGPCGGSRAVCGKPSSAREAGQRAAETPPAAPENRDGREAEAGQRSLIGTNCRSASPV
ncbi:hypothetical protein Asp14428_78440 [Actinoplanes sp. NBRC 14428]|nr:hypothetical protein Asp14428_78440 [Actinoplanes sp. NBRC 14428]